mmetsp:Transcript_861/g.2953  ORF Transcript_861/g.2953 Transcript_861/m.2953 type:complete len:209 (-) Transcript_861:574-1200(-)
MDMDMDMGRLPRPCIASPASAERAAGLCTASPASSPPIYSRAALRRRHSLPPRVASPWSRALLVASERRSAVASLSGALRSAAPRATGGVGRRWRHPSARAAAVRFTWTWTWRRGGRRSGSLGCCAAGACGCSSTTPAAWAGRSKRRCASTSARPPRWRSPSGPASVPRVAWSTWGRRATCGRRASACPQPTRPSTAACVRTRRASSG